MKRGLGLIPVLLVLGAVSSGSAMAQRSGGGTGPSGGSGHGGSPGHTGGPGVGSPGHGGSPGHAGGPAYGGGYGRGYYGHGYYGHGYPYYGYSIALGFPFYWPGYYSGYYPYYPYAYPESAVAPYAGYIEQGAPQAAPAQSQADWFYCADSKAYYPYVRECPAGWRRVPSTPPR
ncbi:MAG TPA: hypothetical protein VIW78_11875 [Burkholderiales bacterium]